MFRTIWERYFLAEFTKVFFLFLFCFYGLYVLIDYASHTSALPSNTIHLHLSDIIRYYTYIFVSKAEILIPIALLIAFIKTVCSLNTHHELVALMASGIHLKTLMRPFIIAALVCTTLLYLNEELILPTALKKLRRIEDMTKHQRKHQNLSVKQIIMEDGSLFLYQSYDYALEQFFDSYWIESIDSIYRIKHLSPNGPTGFLVDHLTRLPSGELLQQASHPSLSFPNMHFNQKILQSAILEPEVLPLSDLYTRYLQTPSTLNEKDSKITTAFYWKLAFPWLPLLAILFPAPLCVRFSRQLLTFLIYISSLFCLIAFFMLMDSSQIIAKKQVLTPFLAIIAPFLIAFAVTSYRFVKMR